MYTIRKNRTAATSQLLHAPGPGIMYKSRVNANKVSKMLAAFTYMSVVAHAEDRNVIYKNF